MADILVIDDEDMVVRLIVELLSQEGHTLVTAVNGKEGLARFKEKETDLVITDIVMPVKEGIETIMELRLVQPELKIIAISGGGEYGDAGDYLMAAHKLGADRIILKPFSKNELLQAVDDLLSQPG